MKRVVILYYILFFTVNYYCRSENPEEEKDDEMMNNFVEGNLIIVEEYGNRADRLIRENIVPIEETEKYYDMMVDSLEDLVELVRKPSTAYLFLNAQGVDRAIMPNIGIKFPKLRSAVLRLLNALFETLPVTTEAVLPVSAIDKLVDIFETDQNLGLKAHALDILYMWLPKNPKAQVRIIKAKGLEPFFAPLNDLDTNVVIKVLDLFNLILEEHIQVRSNVSQRSKADSDKFILYQRMGLIERVSTPVVCNGLFTVFCISWPNRGTEAVPGPAPVIYKLIKNIKPYCSKSLQGQTKATQLLEALLEHINTSVGKEELERDQVNITDTKAVLEEYVKEVKLPRDEF